MMEMLRVRLSEGLLAIKEGDGSANLRQALEMELEPRDLMTFARLTMGRKVDHMSVKLAANDLKKLDSKASVFGLTRSHFVRIVIAKFLMSEIIPVE